MIHKFAIGCRAPRAVAYLTAVFGIAVGTAAAYAQAPNHQTSLPPLEIYGTNGSVAPNVLFLGTPTNWAYVVPKSGTSSLNAGSISVEPIKVGENNGTKVTWTGGIGQIYSQSKLTNDQLDYIDANGALVFDAIVHKKPEDQVTMRIDCRYPCMGIVDMTSYYREAPIDTKQTVKIPLACFEATGTKFTAINTPWLMFTTKPFSVSLANIRWVPGAGKDPDAIKCGN